MKPLGAGSEIDAWCTWCRMDLGHRVVAMVGGAPKRVVCLTCDREHDYRAPRSGRTGPAVVVRRGGEPVVRESKRQPLPACAPRRRLAWSRSATTPGRPERSARHPTRSRVTQWIAPSNSAS
jgi:hypothetical protein